ncbi:MAG: four helix bundle protein [Gemmatimonadetes bacterium]|nr:four helix bundle protein [Gemmatimonadota bacterium]
MVTARAFPSDERFGLTAQIRRSVASIPTNIAEGFGRTGDRERGRFLDIAVGSANEVEYQLLLSKELQYLETTVYEGLNERVIEVRKMFISLRAKLRSSQVARGP